MAFVGELLDFQKEMCLFMVNKKRVINASATGLGKTVEVIAAAEKLFEMGLVDKCIIISLATLKEQWCKSLDKFSSRQYVLVDGGPEARVLQWKRAMKKRIKYVVLNYETLVDHRRQSKKGAESKSVAPLWDLLEKFDHQRCIIACDEGTKIKNWKTKTAKRIKTLFSRWMWILTATPIENSPIELFSLLEWIRRGVLGLLSAFKAKYVITNFFGGVQGFKNLPALHIEIKPYVLRHTREMVKDQLPELIFEDAMVDLGSATSVYRFVRDDLLSVLDGLGSNVVLDEDDESEEMAQILQRYTALRMICQSPQILKWGNSPYAEYLVKNGIIKNQVGDKLPEVAQTVEKLLNEEPGNKLVVFNYYKGFLGMLADELTKQKIPVLMYTGDESKKSRSRAQELFNTNRKRRVILCSDAGIYGLDLPAGTHVLNTDIPWHPGKLEQRNRTNRISSTHTTNTILTITVRRTIEARMYEGVLRKRKVSETVVDGKHRKDSEMLADEFKLNKQTLYKYLKGE